MERMEQNHQMLNNIKKIENIQPFGPPSAPPMVPFIVMQDEITNTGQLRSVKVGDDRYNQQMNISWIRRLVIIQAIGAALIILLQVLFYLFAMHSFNVINISGIGIWGPLFFFSTAICLSLMSTKCPSECINKSALGFQITTTVISSIIAVLCVITLTQPKLHWHYWEETNGKIIIAVLLVCAAVVFVLSICIGILFYQLSCRGKKNFDESINSNAGVVI